MRILFIGNSLASMINFRGKVINHLCDLGYEVIVIAPNDHNMCSNNNKFIFSELLLSKSSFNLFSACISVFHLTKILLRTKPDVIICFTVKPILYSIVFILIRRVTSIAFFTGIGTVFLRKNLFYQIIINILSFVCKKFSFIWFLNASDANLVSKLLFLSPPRISIVPSEGIDLDFFSRPASYLPSSVTNFIMISRVLREKGIIEFIDCYYQLLKTNHIFNFYIVCDRDELVNFCKSYNVSTLFLSTSNFFVLPNVGDVRGYLLSSSCLVLPSYREGMSRILMEAAAMKLPIITTKVPGCIDVVGDSYPFLVESQSSNDLFINLVKFINLSRIEKIAIANYLYANVLRFDVNNVVNFYESFLNDRVKKFSGKVG